jgi:ankyrin repeat protein
LYVATAAQAGPLHDAVKRGNPAQVKRLLGDAANVDARARDGATPLIIAVLDRRDAVARLLIARGADHRCTLPPAPAQAPLPSS